MAKTVRAPLFSGLVFNEAGEPAEVAYVGDEPHYVILDAGFRRHVPSEYVDRQILKWFQDQLALHRETVTRDVLALLGRDDLFSKAMVDASMKNLDELLQYGLPEEARAWLGMLGFQAVVDVHGDLVAILGPIQEEE
ncbi:MAG: hypothetical protein DDG58_00165 [Ardenticatenia bacterium]|jgi:hypothetical protein|nr:MAG: hypothetical protein DDG58_00165 [Ardenticatenia bacterium]